MKFIIFNILITFIICHSCSSSATPPTYWNPLNNDCAVVCPIFGSLKYYAQKNTSTCVSLCPTVPASYADDTIQTCVLNCPWSLSYVTYHDDYYRICRITCPSIPNYYAYNVSNAGYCGLYCPTGLYADDITRSCVSSCPNYHFANYVSNNSANKCVNKCPNNTYISNLNCVYAINCPNNEYGDYINGICTASCPDINSIQMYANTDPSIKLCVFICPNGFYAQNKICVSKCTLDYADNITKTCASKCSNGTFGASDIVTGANVCVYFCNPLYADSNSNRCVLNSGCTSSTYSDPTTFTCVKLCPPGYYADPNNNACVSQCTNGRYGYPINRTCVDNCGTSTLPYLYGHTTTSMCVVKCPVKYGYQQGTTGVFVCGDCPSNLFMDPSTQTCVTTCPINPSLFADNITKSCVSLCSNSYAVISTRTCNESCPPNYTIDNTTNFCVSVCAQNQTFTYFYSVNSSCLKLCPQNYLADPNTMTCIQATSCPSSIKFPILFASQTICVSICPIGKYGDLISRTCNGSCTGAYYSDNSTNMCVSVCPTNPSYYADLATNKCVFKCDAGFFADNTTRTCVANCPTNYSAYIPTQSCLLVCPLTYFIYNDSIKNVCTQICPNDTIQYFIDLTTLSCVQNCPDYYFKQPSLGKCVQIDGCSAGLFIDMITRSCLQTCNPLTPFKDEAKGICVSNCPLQMFSDTATNTCVYNCSSNSFADNSTWKCVQQCPSLPNYYGQLQTLTCVYSCRIELDQYADDDSRTCVKNCPLNTYADQITRRCLNICLKVPATYQANITINSKTTYNCTATCPIDTYADNNTWRCVETCSSPYFGYLDVQNQGIGICVLECPADNINKYFAQNTTRRCVNVCPPSSYADSIVRICMDVCTGNQFADINNLLTLTNGTCVSLCPNSTDPGVSIDTYGDLDTKICKTICPTGTFSLNNTRICVINCIIDTYADSNSNKCIAVCPIIGTTYYYADPSTLQCTTQCPNQPLLYADNSTQTCVSICPNGTYGTSDTRICVIPANCGLNYFADPYSNLCVLKCPATQALYANPQTFICEPTCPSSYYADNSSYTCVTNCPTPYFGYNNKCLISCPSNFYADNYNNIRTCDLNCATPTTFRDPTSQTCVTISNCPIMYFSDNTTGMCVTFCSQGFYADDATKQCLSKCTSGNLYAQNVTRKCVAVCPDQTYGENSSRVCLPACPSQSFSDPSLHLCVQICSIIPNLYGNPDNNSCTTICPSIPDLYADISTRKCVNPCPSGTFADLLTRRCVNKCPVSQFTYADNYTKTCTKVCTFTTDIHTFAHLPSLTCVSLCPFPYFSYNNTISCVLVCPAPTFADDNSRACVIECPESSPFYFHDSMSVSCVSVCPGGYFADNYTLSCVVHCTNSSTIGDTFGYNNQCVLNCSTAANAPYYSENVTRLCVPYCPIGSFADNNRYRCVANCDGLLPQYADFSTETCVKICPTIPLLFADDSSYKCVVTCPLDTYGLIITINNLKSNICVKQCNYSGSVYYADNSSKRCVQNCPSNLLTYSQNFTYTCIQLCPIYNLKQLFADDSTKSCVVNCPNIPFTYAQNKTKTCVYNCPPQSYAQNTTQKCVSQCWNYTSSIIMYRDATMHKCVQVCPQSYYGLNSTNQCLVSCPKNTFADNTTWICVDKCPLSKNYVSYGYPQNNTCIIDCPGNLFGDDLTNQCTLKCSEGLYNDTVSKRCLSSCIDPYYGQPSQLKCVLDCSPTQFKDKIKQECASCPDICLTCLGTLLCTTCVVNYNDVVSSKSIKYYLWNGTCLSGCISLLSDTTCVSNCPIITNSYTYADNLSQSCVYICPNGTYGLNSTKMCITSCPPTFYSSSETQRCQLCINGCGNCKNSSYCINCITGYVFSNNFCIKICSQTLIYYFNDACVTSCPDGTYLMSDQITCSKCSPSCKTCNGTATNCLTCVGGFLYLNGCVSNCPSGYYSDSNLVCQICEDNTANTLCSNTPLNWTLGNYKDSSGNLYSLLTFNRVVIMNDNNIHNIINVTIPTLSSNSYQWTAQPYNNTGNVYIIKIKLKESIKRLLEAFNVQNQSQAKNNKKNQYETKNAGFSLDQIQLQVTILRPNEITDLSGNIVQTTTASSTMPTYDYISPTLISSISSLVSFGTALSWIAIALIIILLIKGTYPMLLLIQVFQIIYFHDFIQGSLPFNYLSFLNSLSIANFQFLPNIFTKYVIPSGYLSPVTPASYQNSVGDITFFISTGQYFTLFLIYLGFVLVIILLKQKNINKFEKIRKYAKKIYLNRIKFGMLNEYVWFAFLSIGFFSMYQIYDLSGGASWRYANFVFSFASLILIIVFTIFIIYKSLSYRKDMSKVPKKFEFIKGDQSFIPFQIALRYFRKILICIFLCVGTLQIQVIAMISANFMVFTFYLFFKPSKSKFTNNINILVEACYLIIQILLLVFANDPNITSDTKIAYGNALIAFSCIALFLILFWAIWQVLLISYEWKVIRNIILQAQLATKIQPQDDNLKVDFEKSFDPPGELISENNTIMNPVKEIRNTENQKQEIIQGIQQQYILDEKKFVVFDNKSKNQKKGLFSKNSGKSIVPSESQQSIRFELKKKNISEQQLFPNKKISESRMQEPDIFRSNETPKRQSEDEDLMSARSKGKQRIISQQDIFINYKERQKKRQKNKLEASTKKLWQDIDVDDF